MFSFEDLIAFARDFFFTQDYLSISSLGVVEKNERGELSDEAERGIQRTLAAYAETHMPGFLVVGEEEQHEWPPRTENFIVIDPKCGTHNSLCGLPNFGGMFTVVVDGAPFFTAIYLPTKQKVYGNGLYVACQGKGAWRLGETEPCRLQVARPKPLRDAFLFLEGPSRTLATSPFARALMRTTKRFRVDMSMPESLTLLGSGNVYPAPIDLVVAIGNKPTDNIHGLLMTIEADGVVTTTTGEKPKFRNLSNLVFASHAELLKQVVDLGASL